LGLGKMKNEDSIGLGRLYEGRNSVLNVQDSSTGVKYNNTGK